MAVGKRNATRNTPANQHNLLHELEGMRSQIQEIIARLEAVVERMVGSEGLLSGIHQSSATPRQELNGTPGAKETAHRNGGPAPESPGDGPAAEALANQIRSVLQQLQSVPADTQEGELSTAIAGQLRRVMEQVEQHGSSQTQLPGAAEGAGRP